MDPIPPTYWVVWLRFLDKWNNKHELNVGVYTSRENAEKGIELVRDQPGFREHPDGFVITQGTIDETDMVNGFVTVRDNGREQILQRAARAAQRAGRVERRADQPVSGMVRQRPRRQHRLAHAPCVGAVGRQVPGVQGGALQGRF